MQKEEIQRLVKSPDEKPFLALVYSVLSLHPHRVSHVVKALNVVIKDEWREKEGD